MSPPGAPRAPEDQAADIVMPEMHGLDLADRAMANIPNLRIVLMTGHAPEPTVQFAGPPQRIRFPNADCTSSTANAAEALRSSRMGLASTTSSDVITPESDSISMRRCASR